MADQDVGLAQLFGGGLQLVEGPPPQPQGQPYIPELNSRLFFGALCGDLRAVSECLAAGADPNTAAYVHCDSHPCFRTALAVAAGLPVLATWYSPDPAAAAEGRFRCVQALLAAGADPNFRQHSRDGFPLFQAARSGHMACLQALLAAGADPAAKSGQHGTALHQAVFFRHTEAVRLLLSAHPAAALVDCGVGIPLEEALHQLDIPTVRCLLDEGPPQQVDLLLASRLDKLPNWRERREPLRPQFMDAYGLLATLQPLTAEQWRRVPHDCDSLAAALPAVLARSPAEAGRLVHRLPLPLQDRLASGALCLARAQAQHGRALPTPIVWRILMLSVAKEKLDARNPGGSLDREESMMSRVTQRFTGAFNPGIV